MTLNPMRIRYGPENTFSGVDVVYIGSGQGQVAGTCECDHELSGSINCGEFLE
jgi:hypothetical protein